jgi:hypothetical protein
MSDRSSPRAARRVESPPSPMKKDPDHNSTDSAEIEALITHIERGQLRDGDAQLLARLLRLLLRLITLLQHKNASLSRLKRLLFGPRSDKRCQANSSPGAGAEENPTPHLQRQLNKLRPIRQRERTPRDPRVKVGTGGWGLKPIPARAWYVVETRNLRMASAVRMMDAGASSTTRCTTDELRVSGYHLV